jgi:hypothetical protein
MRYTAVLLLLVLFLCGPLAAQRVDSTNSHYRLLALDRVITDEHGNKVPAHAKGKLGFVAIYNEQMTLCVVEYVALRNEDLDDARNDRDARVRVFDKARVKRTVFEAAARAAGFTNVNFDKVFVRVP